MEEVKVLEKIDAILSRNECCAECMLNAIIRVISVYIEANEKRIHKRRK